jgi:hypothetical protein
MQLIHSCCFPLSLSSKPRELVPFSVKMKFKGDGYISWLLDIEVNVFGVSYRMIRGNQLLVNGQPKTLPYGVGDDLKVLMKGIMTLTTNFGLEVTFDGNAEGNIYVCNQYQQYVCGICGSIDGTISWFLFRNFLFFLRKIKIFKTKFIDKLTNANRQHKQ